MNGIIYAVAGDDHIPRLLMSVKALRKVCELPFLVYAYLSEQGYKTLTENGIPYVLPALPSMGMKCASRFLKTSVHKVTPFDITAYFDNDIVSVADPSWIFDHVPESGIIFGYDWGKTVRKFSKYACPGRQLHEEISEVFNIEVDPDWTIWNGGLFVFNNKGKAFVESWHQKQLKNIDGIDGWSKRDQGTLVATVWEQGIQGQKCLEPEANFLHGVCKGLSHQRGDGWYNKRSGKPITNIHLCLSWGNESSETWRELDHEINGTDEDTKIDEDTIVVQKANFTEPFKLMVESLLCLDNAATEDYFNKVCTSTSYKIFGKSILSAAVIMVGDKTIVIDYHDLVNIKNCDLSKISKTGNWPDLILKCQYRDGHHSYKDLQCDIVPFTYPTVNSHDGDDYLIKYRDKYLANRDNYKYTLFARLAKHGPRKEIPEATRNIDGADVQLIGMNHGNHQKAKSDGRMGRDEYFEAMANSMFCLDGPGGGNITHRIIEGWAMSQPVICPILKNSMYIPVVAGVHYIPVARDYSDLCDVVEYYKRNFRQAMQIAENGADYYDKYCNKDGIANLFVRILEDYGIL